jgi:hypothetical protein
MADKGEEVSEGRMIVTAGTHRLQTRELKYGEGW